MAQCRDCEGPIRFVRIVNTGRMLPIDPVPDDRGNVWAWRRTVDQWDALVLSPGKAPRPGERPSIGLALSTELRPRSDAVCFMPHAATCPGRVRAVKPRPQPRVEDPLF